MRFSLKPWREATTDEANGSETHLPGVTFFSNRRDALHSTEEGASPVDEIYNEDRKAEKSREGIDEKRKQETEIKRVTITFRDHAEQRLLKYRTGLTLLFIVHRVPVVVFGGDYHAISCLKI